MKKFLWQLLGRSFWLEFESFWSNKDGKFFSIWKQKGKKIKDHYLYKLIGTPRGAILE